MQEGKENAVISLWQPLVREDQEIAFTAFLYGCPLGPVVFYCKTVTSIFKNIIFNKIA